MSPAAAHTPVFRDASTASAASGERRPVWKGFVTGSLAAIAAGVVTHPIDLVKVRLQLAGAAGEAAASPARGILGTAAAVVRADGVRGLYAGLSGSILRQATLIGARIGVFDALKNVVAGPGGSLTFSQSVACGVAAGAASAAVCNPADLVMVRMQADGRLPAALRRNYAHAGEALLRISREEGVAALWRGTTPTVARACVVASAQVRLARGQRRLVETQHKGGGRCCGCLCVWLRLSRAWLTLFLSRQMTFYDVAKAELLAAGAADTAPMHAVASLAAGGAAALSSNPFDVVKTRLQNQGRASAGGARLYSGFADCFATTVRTEGPLALWKGLLATWARQAPLNTVRFVALEQLRRIVG